MSTWMKKRFESVGVTQYPVGEHLPAVQQRFGGTVILALDVSGSMSGGPLRDAVAGGQRFITEALEGNYAVGVVLWHHDVAARLAPCHDRRLLQGFLGAAHSTGGTNVVPALRYCGSVLEPLTGDRVIALFGDGDLGSPQEAKRVAGEIAATGIRIITLGLGHDSASHLDVISTEELAAPRVASAETLAEDIAGLRSGLLRRVR
ncbi:MAG: VWA domain-containing protein [Austwickia sp.]|nr:VWA domain-containing protein [Actinomycetota bacterium]MCB1254181.1 VWA domain-containing protein [Austwickia sp.]MCO5308529.1 VWA domain-containing protein [Austwickia sp.]